MMADVHTLHKSDFYQVSDFKCHCNVCSITQPEYNDSFTFSFTRKGFFEYRTFRSNSEVHVGRILISRPGFEHRTRHIDDQPDITTVFEFTSDFLKHIEEEYKKDVGWFLLNNDIHSVMLQSDPETEYMHHHILQLIRENKDSDLQLDELVLQLLDMIMRIAGNRKVPVAIPDNLKKFHLITIESAKDYLLQNFKKPVSLQKLAEHCHVSPFHFSRIFKNILRSSPHQYLSSIRLNHAKVLLTTTNKPVSDIAFDSGFNSLEHFVTAYRQKYRTTPTESRHQY